MQLKDLALLLYLFALDIPQYEVEKFAPYLAHSTVCDWYKKFRQICDYYIQDISLGSEVETIVEIDESVFGKKQKYNRGKKCNRVWVFGLYESSTLKSYFEVIPNRKNETLLPIIQKVVQTNATIFHDDWAGYRRLEDMGYKHGTVCHKKEFKSVEGVCTNGIEGI